MIVIVGPTASGKTTLGIELAKKLNGAVISADSRQVYTGMDIGTAKPRLNLKGKAKNEKQQDKSQNNDDTAHDILIPDMADGVEHYLFNVRKPDKQMSLAEWQEAAFTIIDNLIDRGMTPLLVGGTMLYVDSVVKNYSLPSVPPNNELRRELVGKDVAELYSELLLKDPKAKEFIEPGNKRRIVRALEVIKVTGRPFSEARQQRPSKYNIRMIGIFPGWEVLRGRVELRAKEMLDEGLIEETKALCDKYGADLPLLQTMNYKQAAQLLDNPQCYDISICRNIVREGLRVDSNNQVKDILEEIVRVNMRYAHRQMSWWKGRREIVWLTEPDVQEAMKALGESPGRRILY